MSNSGSRRRPPSLATTVAGIPMETCVYNASGPRTGSAAALAKIRASQAGAVLTKSATMESQTGNPQPRTWHEANGNASLNSEGLPNAGISYYLDPNTVQEAMGISSNDGSHDASQKPYMVSISGKTLQDNLLMLEKILSSDQPIAAIELNLACPNVIGKPIIGYDFDQMRAVLTAVSKVPHIGGKIPLGVKMPPYLDGPHFAQAAKILNDFAGLIQYVVCINTIGNALAVDATSEAPVIAAKGGFAGLSGRAVKYTALANVRQMRMLLREELDVVGVGGIETGTDAFEMILCGASAVQVGTCHWKEGPKCFDRICDELRDVMKKKGYSNIEEFRGKLKDWSKEGSALARKARTTVATPSNTENAAESMQKTKVRDNFFVWISAGLAVVVAVLLADRMGVVSLG